MDAMLYICAVSLRLALNQCKTLHLEALRRGN